MLFFAYWRWHYSRGVADILILARNYVWFMVHFFSIPLLLSTLFSPWKRLHEDKPEHFDLEGYFGALIVNILMRLFGFTFRITVITIGLVFTLLTLLLSVLGIIIWLTAPLVLVALLFLGLSLTIQAL